MGLEEEEEEEVGEGEGETEREAVSEAKLVVETLGEREEEEEEGEVGEEGSAFFSSEDEETEPHPFVVTSAMSALVLYRLCRAKAISRRMLNPSQTICKLLLVWLFIL
jgi:hypothetical protein